LLGAVYEAGTSVMKRLFYQREFDLKARLAAIYGLLAVLNIGAWLCALAAFHDWPALLGLAMLIYSLGIRHAVDVDHIAAIDNVTRKLMQDNKRPVSVGFFFAMGHSAIVIFGVAVVASSATMLGTFASLKDVGGTFSTIVSALFLLAIAAMNIAIFFSVYGSYRRVRGGGPYVEADLNILLNNRGFLSRIFRQLFRLVTKSWHMFPLGILFGLGFDSASEIAMFGISAAQAQKGVSFGAILIFAMLFAAGMSLIDTTDGVMMLGAYDWAFVKPMRKLYYNMTITLISIVVALLIGGIEALGLIGENLGLEGTFWDAITAVNDNFNNLGFFIIGVFLVAWVVAYLVYRGTKELDQLELRQEQSPASRSSNRKSNFRRVSWERADNQLSR
jgi:high-affinity nickel-transport protein